MIVGIVPGLSEYLSFGANLLEGRLTFALLERAPTRGVVGLTPSSVLDDFNPVEFGVLDGGVVRSIVGAAHSGSMPRLVAHSE